MSRLTDMIKKASQQYYSDGSSEYSDAEFDKMLEDLKQEDPDSELLTDVGHGYDIDKDSTIGQRLNHKYGEIQGLDKAHDYKELNSEFKDATDINIALKLDGMSVVCYFEDSKLTLALTRGSRDGATGIDITDKVKAICENKNIFCFKDKFTGALRGEILMSFTDFETYSKQNPDKARTNPRNTAAGIINRKIWTIDDIKYLNILFYHVVGCENDSFRYAESGSSDIHIIDLYNWLYNNICRFNIVPNKRVIFCEDNFIEVMVETYESLKSQWVDNKYPTDGLVLNKDYSKLGYEIKYQSQAFKFPSEIVESKVVDVHWEMSKTRYCIPRVEIEPVQLAGTTVRFATGFNAAWIGSHKVSKDSKVQITKSGEIIPYILNVDSINSSDFALPRTCPCCGNALRWEGVHLACDNPNCSNMQQQDLLIWMNNLAPQDNFGDLLRLKYLKATLPKEEFTIEGLMSHLTTLSCIPVTGIQDKQFIDMIIKLKTDEIPFKSALLALNIPRIGDVTAKKLSYNPKCILDLLRCQSSDDITSIMFDNLIRCVGQATTHTIVHNLTKVHRLNLILDRIAFPEMFEQRKVAITGKLSIKRKDFEKLLESKGFICTSISKDCEFLITDNPNSNSDKNQKADKWGIAKITEQEFRDKYLS